MRVTAVVKITEADGTVTMPGGTLDIGPEDHWLVEQGLATPAKRQKKTEAPDEGGEG